MKSFYPIYNQAISKQFSRNYLHLELTFSEPEGNTTTFILPKNIEFKQIFSWPIAYEGNIGRYVCLLCIHVIDTGIPCITLDFFKEGGT